MEKKAGYILHSDPAWVSFHLAHSVGGSVAYCRGAGAPMKNVADGGKLCFMIRGTKKQAVVFWADFASAKEVSVTEAWDTYGRALV